MTTEADLKAHEAEVAAKYQAASPKSFLAFTRGLIIPSGTGPRVFDSCMAGFQRRCFEELAPNLELLRANKMPKRRRFWLERTKKASKDGDIGACLLWLTAFAERPFYGQVGAADKDQAGIVKRRIDDILKYNPWLNDYVGIQSWKIKHKGGLAEIDIMAADIAGSHGETPHILVLNELSHISKWEFIENMMDNATGVPQGMVIIATNAGFKGTKPWMWRQKFLSSPEWSCHLWQEPSPWLTPADIQDAKERNADSRFKRLYFGQWSSGKGDALDERDIDRVFSHNIKPSFKPLTGWRYVGGLDLGVKHDHAGLIVVGVHHVQQRIQVAFMQGWEPMEGTGEVDLMAVEDMCLAMHRTFRLEWLGYDPHQAVLMAQRLRKQGVKMHEVNFVGANLMLMADSLKQVIETGILESYQDEEGRLHRDLNKLVIEEKSYGYRLTATKDEYGHADVGTALCILLPRAVAMLEGRFGLQPEDDLVCTDDAPMEKDEVEAMPAELRDIYESAEQEEKAYNKAKRPLVSKMEIYD